jgi:hypothetical protein
VSLVFQVSLSGTNNRVVYKNFNINFNLNSNTNLNLNGNHNANEQADESSEPAEDIAPAQPILARRR